MSQTLNAAANQAGKPASAEVYHAMAVADVIGALRTNLETGLSTDDANARLAQYGANVLPKAKGDTAWTLLWRQINSPLIWVLIASGFVAMLVDPTDGIKNGWSSWALWCSTRSSASCRNSRRARRSRR